MMYDKRTPHRREAARFRRLAASATTPAIKDRLLDEAEQHDNLADLAEEPELEQLAEAAG
jgi:hypothetical protein